MKVINLMLMSLDGEIASRSDETNDERLQQGVSNPYDQNLVKEEIKQSEAVIIGAASVRADAHLGPFKNFRGDYPTWFIYTTRGFDPSLAFWQQSANPRVLVSAGLLPRSSDKVGSLCYGTHPPGQFLLDHLRSKGVERVLLLGGGKVNQIFYGENLVDELKLTIAPRFLGRGQTRVVNAPLPTPVQLELISSLVKDSFIYSHYRIRREN